MQVACYTGAHGAESKYGDFHNETLIAGDPSRPRKERDMLPSEGVEAKAEMPREVPGICASDRTARVMAPGCAIVSAD